MHTMCEVRCFNRDGLRAVDGCALGYTAVPRGMTGGGPVDMAVTSPCPLLAAFIPKAPVFPRTHLGAVTSNGYKIKWVGVRSSHIVNLKADVKLRVVRWSLSGLREPAPRGSDAIPVFDPAP